MWNGMKITSETARKVVEVYIQTPHFTNILAWLEGTGNHLHSRLRTQQNSSAIHNGRTSVTGSIGARRPVATRATNDQRGATRRLSNEGTGEDLREDTDVTPTHAPRPSQRMLTTAPPSFDRVLLSSGPSQGQSVVNMPCVMNADGSFSVLGHPPSTERLVAGQLSHHQQIPSAPSQAFPEPSRGSHVGASRYRGRGGPRGGMRGGMAHALRLRAAKSVPTIRESDFDKFRNRSPDGLVSPESRGHLITTAAPKPINVLNSHFNFRAGPLHARSSDTLVPFDHPNYDHTVQVPSTSIRRGNITPLGFFPDPFATPTTQLQHTRTRSRVDQNSSARSMDVADSFATHTSLDNLPQLKQNSGNTEAYRNHAQAGVYHNAHSQQVTEEWKQRAIVDRIRPNEQTASFYPQSVDKAASVSDGGQSLRSDGSKLSLRQQAEYYRILAEKAEYEANVNERLARLGVGSETSMFPHMPGASSDSSSRPRTRGSSDLVGSTVETSSVEQYNISPVRNKSGTVLRSASKHGSPDDERPTKAGLRARNAPYQESWDSNVKRTVDQLVTSPPSSSVGNNAHISPQDTASLSSDSTYGTTGISGGINLQYQ
nr:hypothetical protein CFP56_37177 [Quercus suber]